MAPHLQQGALSVVLRLFLRLSYWYQINCLQIVKVLCLNYCLFTRAFLQVRLHQAQKAPSSCSERESTCPAVCSSHRSSHLSCVYSSCVTSGECKDANQRMCWARSWWKWRLCVILELFMVGSICVSNLWASCSLARNRCLREKNCGWIRIVKISPLFRTWPPWVVGARVQGPISLQKIFYFWCCFILVSHDRHY